MDQSDNANTAAEEAYVPWFEHARPEWRYRPYEAFRGGYEAATQDCDAEEARLRAENTWLRALVARLTEPEPWLPCTTGGAVWCQWCRAVDYAGYRRHQHRPDCRWLAARKELEGTNGV